MTPWLAMTLWLQAVLSAPLPASQRSQETGREETKLSRWLHDVYLREASAYEFYIDRDKRQKLELRTEPVMRWTSDADYRGEVYVWTHQGRPSIVGCIFSAPQGDGTRRIMHEFHSLAPRPLTAGARGASGWQPQEPGITPEPIPDAPAVADTDARRLAQMRELARRFTAHMATPDQTWQLRLLPQPLYRYERTDDDAPTLDGCVFAYVWTIGTDPEVLLVIEARRTDDGTYWHAAPARFTNREAWVKYQDREIWRVEAATVGIFDGVTSKGYGAFSVKSIANPPESP